MVESELIHLSVELDGAGLVWHPEIGDEIVERGKMEKVSILVDPLGLSLQELRASFIWLPTLEQLVSQFEARQAFIYHAGITEKMCYEAIVRTANGVIEASASTLRVAFGRALHDLLKKSFTEAVH